MISAKISLADDYWLRQQTPVTALLHEILFTDSLYGWAAGDSGYIIHTTDGGQNWVLQNSGIDYNIDDLFFLNRRLGWGVANDFLFKGSTILYTTNGGINWSSYRYPDTSLSLITIFFLDSLNGWLAGFSKIIFHTTNGGVNWIPRQIDSTVCFIIPLRNFSFYSPDFAFASGGHFDIEGSIVRTVNGGLSWSPVCISPEPIFGVVFFDSLHLIGAGGDFEYGASIIRTSDGGISWEYKMLNLFGAGQAIAFRTRAEGWIPLGFANTWAYTLDSGNTWRDLGTPDSLSIYDVIFTDPYHGWAAGDRGSILKYNSDMIGIQNQQNSFPRTNTLYQNYPNPFNPSTTIEFDLSRNSRVVIILYDVLGKEIRILLNELRKAGNHKIKFNAGGLPSGVYFYKLITADYTETKKFVILK